MNNRVMGTKNEGDKKNMIKNTNIINVIINFVIKI